MRAIGRPGARSSNCVFVDEREKATRLAAPARSRVQLLVSTILIREGDAGGLILSSDFLPNGGSGAGEGGTDGRGIP